LERELERQRVNLGWFGDHLGWFWDDFGMIWGWFWGWFVDNFGWFWMITMSGTCVLLRTFIDLSDFFSA
jgi:hypothetical protein